MSRLLRIAAVALFPGLVSAAYADTSVSVTGSYTATDTETSGTAGYAPNINTANSFLSSPFTVNLKVGTPTTASEFIDVEPTSGGSSVGSVAGTVAVYFDFSGFSTVTKVTSSASNGTLVSGGANNGRISVTGYYDLNYASSPDQSDCITWSSTSCTPANSNDNIVTSVGDVLTITFANNAVLAVTLNNWSDWDMAPTISFNLVTAPHSVPEPASIALFGSSLAALGVIRRRSRRARGGAISSSPQA